MEHSFILLGVIRMIGPLPSHGEPVLGEAHPSRKDNGATRVGHLRGTQCSTQ